MTESGWSISSGSPTAEMVMLKRDFGPSSVSVTLRPDADGVTLHRLRAEPASSGGGKAGMASICEAADGCRMTLTLRVRPFGPSALDERALERFYGRFGFETDPYSPDYSAMVRYPGPGDDLVP